MPLHGNLIKEELSHAYLLSLAASIGLNYEISRIDNKSEDVQLAVNGKLNPTDILEDALISIQLKSTVLRYPFLKETFPFKLKQKNYNDLCKRAVNPKYLFVLVLPPQPHISLSVLNNEADSLILSYAMFWHSLSECEKTNQTNKTIHINTQNIVDIETLKGFISKAANTIGGISLCSP